MAQTFTGRKRVRKVFGHVREVGVMPNLIEVQKASYDQFLIMDAPKGGRLAWGILGTFDSLNPLIVRGLAVHGWSLLGDGEWPFLVIRRRQATLQRGVAELNAYLGDLEADRPRLHDTVTTAKERLEAKGGTEG